MMMKKLGLLLLILGILIQVQAQENDLGAIITLDWDNTGSHLALGYEGGDIVILDLETGIRENIGEIDDGNVLSIDWHPINPNLIIVGMTSIYYRIYDVSTNQLISYVDVNAPIASSVSWNIDATLIASAANWVRDDTKKPRVDIWDATTLELVASFTHEAFITEIIWHPSDPRKLASTSYDEITRFWDVDSEEQYNRAIYNPGGGLDIAWSFNENQIAISSGDSVVRIFSNPPTEDLINRFELTYAGNLDSKYDGTLAMVDATSVKITDVEAREIFETLEMSIDGVDRAVNDVAWSIDGKIAYGASNNSLIYLMPNTYYIVDEASDLARFIEMANANTSMNMFDVRGDFDLTAPLPIIAGDITIIGDESQLTTLRELGMFTVGEGGQLSFEIRENEEGA
jgi:WD40 repeat protein